MKKGGYKIIDLKNTNLTLSGANIKGLYEEIESNYRKPILLSGIIINGYEYADQMVNFVSLTAGLTCEVFTTGTTAFGKYLISVNSADHVTIAAE